MQVVFKRWSMSDNEHDGLVSINPVDVVATEFAHPAYPDDLRYHGDKGKPEATRVILRKGKEYWVQGSVEDVATLLNATETKEESVE